MHKYRTHKCDELRSDNVKDIVKLSGWVHRKRDHGQLIFIDLRDHYGLTQVVVDSSNNKFSIIEGLSALFNSYQSLLKNRESLIYIEKISNNFNNVETDYNIKLRKQFQNIKLQNISYDYGLNKKIFYNLNLDLDKYSSNTNSLNKDGSWKDLINLFIIGTMN